MKAAHRLAILLAFALAALPAGAQSFTATPATGRTPLATTLDWNVPGATSCTASGAWSGAKPAQGSQALTLTQGGQYKLDCAVAGPAAQGTAAISWTGVTLNTDGTPASIAKYRIYRAVGGAGAMAILQDNINPTARSSTDPALAPGTYRYQMTAVDTANTESAPSGEGSKVVPNTPTSTPWSAQVAITVLPAAIPAAPTVTVQ